MLNKSTKVLVFILIVLCLVAVFQVNNSDKAPRITMPTKRSSGNLPVRIARIYFEPDQREQLFEQFRIFAARNAFAIKITLTNPVEEHYLVTIWGNDVQITGDNIELGNFFVGFHDMTPSSQVPMVVFDKLMASLQALMTEIPNVRFVIEK